MNIYLNNETNFERNGLGYLTDCISAKVNESLNGDYTLTLEYPLYGRLSEYLIEDNIIKCNVGDNNFQLFRIQRVVKNFSTINVFAYHITYDLINNFLDNVAPTNKTCSDFGSWILENTNYSHPFTFYSDITSSASARYVRKNPIEAIISDDDNSMINLFGGDIERDNFNIKLLRRRGADNHVKALFGKNIREISISVDITSMYTRIMPLGFNGLMLPEKYVDSPIINNYPTPRVTKVEFSNIRYDENSEEEQQYSSIEDAYQALRDATNQLYANGIDLPVISIDIDWLELSKTNEYKMYQNLEKVKLGDTVTASILGIDYTTRVTSTEYNVLTDNIDSFTLGTITRSIVNTLNEQKKVVEEFQPDTILDEAKNAASSLIKTAMGGYIYKTQNELFIMDKNDPNTAQKVWRWNVNGLGYSKNGINGDYGLAMTMDGNIVADFITTGKLKAIEIENGSGFHVDAEGNVVANNIDVNGGKIADFSIYEKKLETEIRPDYNFTQEDFQLLRSLIIAGKWTQAQLEKYDLNRDGKLNVQDLSKMNKLIKIPGISRDHPGHFRIQTGNDVSKIENNQVGFFDGNDNLYTGFDYERLVVSGINALVKTAKVSFNIIPSTNRNNNGFGQAKVDISSLEAEEILAITYYSGSSFMLFNTNSITLDNITVSGYRMGGTYKNEIGCGAIILYR